jgi:hypothetical protein
LIIQPGFILVRRFLLRFTGAQQLAVEAMFRQAFLKARWPFKKHDLWLKNLKAQRCSRLALRLALLPLPMDI